MVQWLLGRKELVQQIDNDNRGVSCWNEFEARPHHSFSLPLLPPVIHKGLRKPDIHYNTFSRKSIETDVDQTLFVLPHPSINGLGCFTHAPINHAIMLEREENTNLLFRPHNTFLCAPIPWSPGGRLSNFSNIDNATLPIQCLGLENPISRKG